MKSLSSVTNDINKMTIEMQDNVKDLQKLTAKVPNFENSFKSINEEIRKNEEEMKAKFDEQNGKFNDEIRNVLSKYNELERKLKFVDESMKKLREDKMVEQFDLKSQELVGKIWKTQVKSEELERKTNDLEVSLNDKFEELEHKINAINKSDSLINLLEETKIELQDLVQKKIGENEENILKRLEEDRTKKLALMISTVEEEAKKIYGRLEIVESYYEILKKEFKECDAEIMRRMEEENVISDQMIRDKISEAIDLYTTEYDAKVTQRIREAIESYEARVNKLADASFELEATFSEEIQKTAEKRIRVMEEENRKLKEQRRELKNKLEAKEAECFECKIECDRSDEIITGLGKDKFELENKVRQLKSERKRMETQIKETEDQVHEIERTYKEKLEENNEEIRKMKVNFEKLGQQIKLPKLINFGIKDG
jgi:chromosome segregation ATPase